MKTRCVADVVFCLDSSESMDPCLEGLKNNIASFIEGIQGDGQNSWDVRFDFVSHQSLLNAQGGVVINHSSLYNSDLLDVLYGDVRGRFFTRDVGEFKAGINRIKTKGDESPLIAIDSCLDFPWRDEGEGHRVVVFLTDEPFETCLKPEMEKEYIDHVIQKIMDLNVIFFLIAPDSEGFERISSADKSEYVVIESEVPGLTAVDFTNFDFQNLLSQIGKSVSVSSFGQQKSHTIKSVKRGVFGQSGWGVSEGLDTRDRTSSSNN